MKSLLLFSLVFFFLTLCPLMSQELSSPFQKIDHLNNLRKKTIKLNQDLKDQQEKEKLGKNLEKVPRTLVTLSKKTFLWDSKELKHLYTPREMTIEIYLNPFLKEWYFISSEDPDFDFRYQVRIRDVHPLHPIEELHPRPPFYEEYPRRPFITQEVKAHLKIMAAMGVGANYFTFEASKKTGFNPYGVALGLKFLAYGVYHFCVGMDILYRNSVVGTLNQVMGEEAFYLGPTFLLPLWTTERGKRVLLESSFLKSVSYKLKKEESSLYFDNVLFKVGFWHESPGRPSPIIWGVSAFYEWYRLGKKSQGQFNDLSLSSKGFLFSFGLSQDLL